MMNDETQGASVEIVITLELRRARRLSNLKPRRLPGVVCSEIVMPLTIDDLAEVPHVVIVETETGIRIIEFERGQMEYAHQTAQDIALQRGFVGRVIVAARVRVMQPYEYAKRHGT